MSLCPLIDYPLGKMSKHLSDCLNATLKSYNKDMLKAFFDYCIRELANEAGKGIDSI